MLKEVIRSLEIISKGGIILYPTDTIWGIGCDACKANSIEKIYRLKNRPGRKSMIVLLDKEERLSHYVQHVPEMAYELMKSIKTPLTIVYPGGRNVAKNLLSEDGSLAIRIVKDAFCEALISEMKAPLVSTSANISGEPAPLTFGEISVKIINGVDYVVDYARNEIRQVKASTIIQFNESGDYTVLRK